MWLGLGMAGRDPIGHRKIKIQMKNVFKFSLIACHPVHFLWFRSQTPPPLLGTSKTMKMIIVLCIMHCFLVRRPDVVGFGNG
jgi:hypothetical protein